VARGRLRDKPNHRRRLKLTDRDTINHRRFKATVGDKGKELLMLMLMGTMDPSKWKIGITMKRKSLEGR
ncbi:hypothetical protein OFB51_26490, partial [Escherichia coli]|nr:hypothetical protein [Escherichia coli]